LVLFLNTFLVYADHYCWRAAGIGNRPRGSPPAVVTFSNYPVTLAM
jgi:hypothetical protein